MKNVLAFKALLLMTVPAAAQSLALLVFVEDSSGNPLPGIAVYAVEPSLSEEFEAFTDEDGYAEIMIETGRQWVVSIGKMRDYQVLRMPASGDAELSMLVVYDESWNAPPPQEQPAEDNENNENDFADPLDAILAKAPVFNRGRIHFTLNLDWELFNKKAPGKKRP